jgi:thiamine-monophosphate kinase
MSSDEFDIIERYFHRPLPARDDVLVGIGDDGAVLRVGDGQTLVTSVATLSTAAWDASAGDPTRLGHDAMAKALAPLTAAGARPAWATLALTLPEADHRWLAPFSDALFAVAVPLSVALIGGDTTRGPFTVTVVGHGLLDRDAPGATSGIGAGQRADPSR